MMCNLLYPNEILGVNNDVKVDYISLYYRSPTLKNDFIGFKIDIYYVHSG